VKKFLRSPAPEFLGVFFLGLVLFFPLAIWGNFEPYARNPNTLSDVFLSAFWIALFCAVSVAIILFYPIYKIRISKNDP